MIVRFVPALILAAGSALLALSRDQSAPALNAPLASLPVRIGMYAGQDVNISDQELVVAGVSDYVMRVFTRDSLAAFSVYVGYYPHQTQGRTIHSPKNCLPGTGWEAFDTGVETISVGADRYTVNRYLLANGEARAMVYYWYQGRGRVAANEYTVKWDLLRDAALHGRSEEALVRVVVPMPPAAGHLAARTLPEIVTADSIAAMAVAALVPSVYDLLPPWKKS